MQFRVLQVKDEGNVYGVYGVVYEELTTIDLAGQYVKATSEVCNVVEEALANGKIVKIPKTTKFEEIQENELIIEELGWLETAKNLAIAKLDTQLKRALVSMSMIDFFSFTESLLVLLDAGIVITDENRHDKYQEVVEAAQLEEPVLPDKPTLEQETEYLALKSAYDRAMRNIDYLERYLNARDQLSRITWVSSLVTDAKTAIGKATSDDEIEVALNTFNLRFNNPS